MCRNNFVIDKIGFTDECEKAKCRDTAEGDLVNVSLRSAESLSSWTGSYIKSSTEADCFVQEPKQAEKQTRRKQRRVLADIEVRRSEYDELERGMGDFLAR